ncbi:MAG: inositol monophosphatase family protein [Desulfocapsaceae bacterium]|nr:inositol monophosphatase family protein [Desulfocapsaceae bacterium]
MLNFIKKLAADAGRICLDGSEALKATDVQFKNPKDLVTIVDRKVEDYLIAEIRKIYPDHSIIGEETGRAETGSDCCWIIDPIDGTTSFFHGQPYYAVSIAFSRNGKLEAGVVHAPALRQLFAAEKGKGSFLNDKRIQVSATASLQESVLGTGFACLRAGWEKNNLTYLNRIMPAIRDIRRCGSAAIDLAYVAAGKFDGFWEMNLNIYDIAAGALLVAEAGGTVCDFAGGASFPEAGIVATNGRITEALLDYLRE